MNMATSVTVANGKYMVQHVNGAKLCAYRYNTFWRDLCGDGLVLALVQEIEDLREQVRALQEQGIAAAPVAAQEPESCRLCDGTGMLGVNNLDCAQCDGTGRIASQPEQGEPQGEGK